MIRIGEHVSLASVGSIEEAEAAVAKKLPEWLKSKKTIREAFDEANTGGGSTLTEDEIEDILKKIGVDWSGFPTWGLVSDSITDRFGTDDEISFDQFVAAARGYGVMLPPTEGDIKKEQTKKDVGEESLPEQHSKWRNKAMHFVDQYILWPEMRTPPIRRFGPDGFPSSDDGYYEDPVTWVPKYTLRPAKEQLAKGSALHSEGVRLVTALAEEARAGSPLRYRYPSGVALTHPESQSSSNEYLKRLENFNAWLSAKVAELGGSLKVRVPGSGPEESGNTLFYIIGAAALLGAGWWYFK
jgi:hypothetical protein